MTFGKKTLVLLGATIIVAAVVGSHSIARAGDTADMNPMVMEAKTKADHEKLAAAYEQQAADAKATSETHQHLAESYRKMPSLGKGIGDLPGMIRHCQGLAKLYSEAAQNLTVMAKMERSIATKLP